MGDMGEFWRAVGPDMKARSKAKRLANVVYAHERLTEEKIEFEVKNCGQHLIVKATNARIVDYWPSTGKWIVRTGQKGRGIHGVLKLCGVHLKG